MRPMLLRAGVMLGAPALLAAGLMVWTLTALASTRTSTTTSTTSSTKTSTKTSTSASRPWLGVVTQSLDEDLKDGLGYTGDGVLVNRVADDSPAAKAGIKQGDVIVSMNGKTVSDPDDLQELVRSAKPGDKVSITIARDNKQQQLSATLVGRPNDMSWGDDSHRIVIRESPEMRLDLDNMPDLMELPGMGHGRLGVQLEDLNSDLGGYFSVPDGKGALVMSVVDGSAADKAGLKAGDVIVKIGDKAIEDSDDATRAIRSSDGATPIEVVRKGKRTTLTATLTTHERERMHRAWRMSMNMDGLPGVVDDATRHAESDLRREMNDLKREIHDLSEQLKQKSQN